MSCSSPKEPAESTKDVSSCNSCYWTELISRGEVSRSVEVGSLKIISTDDINLIVSSLVFSCVLLT